MYNTAGKQCEADKAMEDYHFTSTSKVKALKRMQPIVDVAPYMLAAIVPCEIVYTSRSNKKRETGIEPVTIRAAIERSTTELPAHTYVHANCNYYLYTTYPSLRLPRRVFPYGEHSHHMFS